MTQSAKNEAPPSANHAGNGGITHIPVSFFYGIRQIITYSRQLLRMAMLTLQYRQSRYRYSHNQNVAVPLAKH